MTHSYKNTKYVEQGSCSAPSFNLAREENCLPITWNHDSFGIFQQLCGFFFFLLSVTFYRWHILNLNANLEFSFMYFAFYKAFQATWNRCNEILKYILNMYLGFLKKSKNTNEVQNIHKHSKAQIWQVRCNLERYIRIL